MSEQLSSRLSEISQEDYPLSVHMEPPVHRKAYSDRSAWLMATLADIAYEPFEQSRPNLFQDLAEELAAMGGNSQAIREKLLLVRSKLSQGSPDIEEAMEMVLAVGGFELVGTFFSRTFTPLDIPREDFKDPKKLLNYIQDTQGFVAVRRGTEKQAPMAVLVFRGTTNIKDWITNANSVLQQAPDGETRIHPGFRKAYENVEYQILELLKKVQGVPLYITGHSLGGALAICATYFLSKDSLAACYTFGGPKVGDQDFVDRFKTPIYRLVNGLDPIPMLPPSGTLWFFLKLALSKVPVLGKVLPFLVNNFSYSHAGDQRYLTDAEALDSFGSDWSGLVLQKNVGTWTRLKNYIQVGSGRQGVISYHSMKTYRRKLRYLAKQSNTTEVVQKQAVQDKGPAQNSETPEKPVAETAD